MIKVLLLLDCDECGHSLDTATVRPTFERQVWEREIDLLIHQAEWQGWRFMRGYGICRECILEEEKMADWLQEPEDDKY
jgi:hypothetical protein